MMSPLLHPEDMDRLISERQARLARSAPMRRPSAALRGVIGRALIAAGTALAGDRVGTPSASRKVAHHGRSI